MVVSSSSWMASKDTDEVCVSALFEREVRVDMAVGGGGGEAHRLCQRGRAGFLRCPSPPALP